MKGFNRIYDLDVGLKGDPVATTDTGSFSLISLFKRSLEKLTAIGVQLLSLIGLSTLIESHTDEINQSVGEVSLTPTANTIQDRLKTIYESLGSGNTALADILAELRDDSFINSFLWEDGSVDPHIFYREDRVRSQDDGSIATVYTRLSDNVVVVSLPAGSHPVAGDNSKKVEFYRYIAIAGGTGFTAGDWLTNTIIFDIDSSSIVSNNWYNLTTALAITAPLYASVKDPEYDNNLEATQILLKNEVVYQTQYVSNSSKGIVVSNVASTIILAANTNRKAARFRNLNIKTMYITTVSPATSNDVIILVKGELWIETESTKAIYAIWEAGATGDGVSYEEITN